MGLESFWSASSGGHLAFTPLTAPSIRRPSISRSQPEHLWSTVLFSAMLGHDCVVEREYDSDRGHRILPHRMSENPVTLHHADATREGS